MIETNRLLLRPMLPQDIDPLLGIFGDPRVMASFGVAPFDRDQMQRWVQRNLDHQDRHGYGLFVVILRESGELIGDCGLEEMELDDVSGAVAGAAAELGYDFRSDHWNQGFATEAATAVRDYAFGTLALPRLISLIRQGNTASRRVAEKIGMHHERDMPRADHPYWLFAIDDPGHQPASRQPPITPA